MSPRTDAENPWIAFGMSSLVLAFIGTLFFFLPILGTPISGIALGFGIIGLIVSPWTPGPSLRWSLAGIVASLLALSVNLLIIYAPEGYQPDRKVPTPWRAVPDRPFVPPPARSGGRPVLQAASLGESLDKDVERRLPRQRSSPLPWTWRPHVTPI